MPASETVDRDGVRLAIRDFGGSGPPVLIIHGLAGQAEEWSETARWLSLSHHVLALDTRGHGRSERRPTDVTREAHVSDTEFVIEHLAEGPVCLIGHSLGGITVLQVAARRPDLVKVLVVVDASPIEFDESVVDELASSLRKWPAPFTSKEQAIVYFGGPSLAAEAWTGGLEERDGGYWPPFEIDIMIQTLREASQQSYWGDWAAVQCPVLVVRAEHGLVPDDIGQTMLDRTPQASLVDIPEASHDLHLDHPAEWKSAVLEFFRDIETTVR